MNFLKSFLDPFFAPDGGGGGNDALNTEIGIDFSPAEKDIKDFNDKINSIATTFKSVSDSVRNLNASVSDKIVDYVSKVNGVNEVEITNALKTKIEKALAAAVLNKDIDLKDKNGNKLTYKFSLNESQLQKLSKKIADDFVQGFNPSFSSNIPVNIGTENINTIRNKLQKTIDAELANSLANLKSPVGSEAYSASTKSFNAKVKEKLTRYLGVSAEELTEKMPVLGGGDASKSKLQSDMQKLTEDFFKIFSKNINNSVKNYVDSIKNLGSFTGNESYSIDTNKLNSKVKERLAKYLGVSIKEFTETIPTLEGGDALKASLQSDMQKLTGDFFKAFYKNINNSVKSYSNNIKNLGSFTGIESFSINTSSLNKKVKENLARYLNVSVDKLLENIPVLKGSDAFKAMMQSNMQKLTEDFFKAFSKNLKKSIKEYTKSIKGTNTSYKVDLKFLQNQFSEVQYEIIKKVKKAISDQMNVLIREIRGMQIIPGSIGARTSSVASSGITQPTTTNSVRAISPNITSLAHTSVGLPAASSYSFGNIGRKGGYITEPPKPFINTLMRTMRYTISSLIMGLPLMMANKAWESYKESTYQYEKANQNILAKYRSFVKDDNGNLVAEFNKPYIDLAENQLKARVQAGLLDEAMLIDPKKKEELVEQLRTDIADIATRGIKKALQSAAVGYGLEQNEMASMYQIGTRRYSNPFEALAQTSAAARIFAVEREEITPMEAAAGMEAIASQWGINPLDKGEGGERIIDRFANMIIKGSLLSQSTAKDLLEAQQRTGSVFRTFLPSDMSKEEQFATSIALQSFFMNSTGRSGAEAGTFWRTIFSAPFSDTVGKVLESYAESEDEQLRKLSPYKSTYGDDYQRWSEQKSGYEMFMNIIDSFHYLKSQGKDAEANSLVSSFAKNRNFGSFGAISAFIEDLTKLNEKMDATRSSSVKDYIDSITFVKQEEIDRYLGGTSQTVEFKQNKLKSQWEASTSEIFETLKPEFSKLLDYLTGLLRIIGRNAQSIGTAIDGITKMLVAYGAYKLIQKGYNRVTRTALEEQAKHSAEPLLMMRANLIRERFDIAEEHRSASATVQDIADRYGVLIPAQEPHLEELGKIRNHLKAEGAKLKELKEHDSAAYYRKEQEIVELEDSLHNPNLSDEERQEISRKLAEAEEAKNELKNATKGTPEEIESQTNKVRKIAEQYTKENHVKKEYDKAMKDMLPEEQKVIKKQKELDKSLKTIDKDIKDVDKQLKNIKKSYAGLGVAEKSLDDSFRDLDIEFRELVAAERSVISETDVLNEDIEKLNRAFEEGAVTGRDYINILNQIEGQSMPLSGIGNMTGLTNLSSITSTGIGAIASSALAGVGAATGLFIASQVGDSVGNAIMSQTLTEGEQLQQKYSNYEEVVNRGASVKKLEDEGKSVRAFLYGRIAAAFPWLKNGLNYLFGDETALSPSEWGNAYEWSKDFGSSRSKTLLELEELKKKADIKTGEEQRAEEKRIQESWIDIDGDGEKDISPKVVNGSVQSVDEQLSLMNERADIKRGQLNESYTKDRLSLRLTGARSDSDEVRELMNKFLKGNISILQAEVDEMEAIQKEMIESRGESAKRETGYRKIEKERLSAQKELMDLQNQLIDNTASKIEEIESRITRQMNLAVLGGERDISSLVAGGIREESQTIIDKQIETNIKRKELLEQKNKELREQLGYVMSEDEANSKEKELSELEFDNDVITHKLAAAALNSQLTTEEREELYNKRYKNKERIELLRDALLKYNLDKDARDKIEESIAQNEAEAASIDKANSQLNLSRDTEIINRHMRAIEMSGYSYEIQKSGLETKGYTDDSMAMKLLTRTQLENSNKGYQSIISELKNQLSKYSVGDYQYEDTLKYIRQYEALIAQNTANIYKLMQNNATFGLPAGITPITNYAYEAKKNSEGSLAVQQGNVVVNVKFDKVYANSKEDVEKNIVKPIEEAISKINREVTTSLNRQVNSYVSNRRY